jgi:hypothetical protein
MTKVRGPLMTLALVAVLLAACSTQLRTATVESEACMLALTSGTLARHPETGLGIAGPEGTVQAVEWPFGYSAWTEVSQTVLVDETGKVIAREGDQIEVGGGLGNGEQLWHACGGVQVVAPG